jgi:glycosyltransferase involved in cell wall biosynthesis
MKTIVAHHLWARVGGAELVNAYVLKTLLETGHKVVAVSTFGFGRKKYKEWFGINLEDIKVYSLLPRMLPLFGIYQRLGFCIALSKAIRKEEPDMVFVDNDLYKSILKLKKRKEFKLMEYIHFPFHILMLEKRDVPEEYREALNTYVADAEMYHIKYKAGLWKQYFKLFYKLHERFARDNPFDVADVVMTNSRYIAGLIKILWQGEPIILNPPVKIRDFELHAARDFEERDDAITIIGRISPEKRIEDVIDAIALTDTKPVLRVIGGLISSAIPYREFLKRRAKEKGVRVEYFFNVPREELIKIATLSKALIHATRGEHFGIAVVEGMAAGCPVVVHMSGGPYEDIIDYGRWGLFFDSLEELADVIDRLITTSELWRHYHKKSLKRALEFGEEEFAKKFLEVVKDSY